MIPQLDYSDAHYFLDALGDQSSLQLDIEIRRCVGINTRADYPGEKPEIMRNSIFTRAEMRLMELQEISRSGGLLVSGDLKIRSDVELRGIGTDPTQDYGDKRNPDQVSDIIVIPAPYQGEWYVIGVPEHAQLVSQQGAIFWNAFIRRVKTGNRGKQ